MTARVALLMDRLDPREKTLIFCASQAHVAAVRDLVNQQKANPDPLYCCRVTANDGALGEQHLRSFQDNEKSIPTVLTTSQKLSTGVDARNVRNIALLRCACLYRIRPAAHAHGAYRERPSRARCHLP